MTSRRLKDKAPAVETSIVKKEPVSPLDIVNRFTQLNTIPKPNYSSILACTYDPYALTNVTQPVVRVLFLTPNFIWVPPIYF